MSQLITRRSVLLGGALLAAGGAAGGVAWLPGPAPAMRVLSGREVEIVEAMARVLFPPGTFSVAGGDGGTAPLVDAIVADMMEPPAAAGFRYMLRAIELGTLIARGVRVSQLAPDEAREVVDIWFSEEPAPRRMASDAYKVIVGMGFLRRPEVVREIGWRRGCFDEMVDGPA